MLVVSRLVTSFIRTPELNEGPKALTRLWWPQMQFKIKTILNSKIKFYFFEITPLICMLILLCTPHLRCRSGRGGGGLTFLSDTFQKMVLGDCCLSSWSVKYGVPEGSILSPMLSKIYLKHMGEVIRGLGLYCNQYTDNLVAT